MYIVLILLSLFFSEGQAKAEPSSSRIAAIVNKNVITRADLMNRLRLAALSSGLAPTPENLDRIKDQMLRVMIDEQLQLAAAEEAHINVTDQQIQEAIKRLETANQMPAGQIAKMMAEHNIPLKTLETQVRSNLMWIELVREKYMPTLQISDAEVEQERNMRKETESKTLYHLAEIVLPFETPEEERQVESDLNRLIEELQKGAHFSALAQQFSQSATAARGGDMGWVTEDQLLPEVNQAIQPLEPGRLSMPIRTSQGYVIIGYIDKKQPGTEKVADLSEAQIQTIIAEKKLELLSNRDLRDLRRHAFIDIRS